MSVFRSPQVLDARESLGLDETEVVLDLDHTLVNSFEYGQTVSWKTIIQPVFEKLYCDEDGQPELYNAAVARVLLLIKLRPGVRRFLTALVAHGARLHVYTKGARVYMEAILRLLDPDGSLIRGSRWSREDDHGTDRKFSHRLFSHITAFSKRLLILDDSPHIWDIENSPLPTTLVPVDRYEFAEQLFSPAPALPHDADSFLRAYDGPLWMKILECIAIEQAGGLAVSTDVPVMTVHTPTAASAPSVVSGSSESPVGRLVQKIYRMQPNKKLGRLNSETSGAAASSIQDREERKLQYYMELFAKQEREELMKRKRDGPVSSIRTRQVSDAPSPAPAAKSAPTSAPASARATANSARVSDTTATKAGKDADTVPIAGPSSARVTRTPASLSSENESEVAIERRKPGRKPRGMRPEGDEETEKTRKKPGRKSRIAVETGEHREAAALMFEIIDEQRQIGRKKIALEVLPEPADQDKMLKIPKDMSKPIPTEDIAADPIEWAQQFIKLI